MSAFIMTRLLSSALIYLRPARPLLSLTAATGRPRGQASSKWLALTNRAQFITHYASPWSLSSGRYFITSVIPCNRLFRRDLTGYPQSVELRVGPTERHAWSAANSQN